MRISDWSSDVCSSDLHLIGVAIGGHLRPGLAVELHPRVEPLHRLRIDASGQALQRRQPARRAAREVAAIQVHRLVLGEVVAAVVEHAQPVVRDQNGRASWWERGCQYGSSSVGAGSITKKTKKK